MIVRVGFVLSSNRLMKQILFVLTLYGYFPVVSAFWPSVPEIPQATHYEVAEKMIVNGMEIQITRFVSKLNTRQVLAFYRARWRDGYAESEANEWQQISRMQGKYFINVQVKDNGFDGSTGRISILRGDKKRQPVGQGIPLLPGSRILNEVYSEDKYTTSRMVVAINPYSEDDNRSFYTEYFSREEWKVMEDRFEEGKGVMLFYKKNRDEFMITIKQGNEGTTLVMNKVQQRGLFD